MKKNVRSWCAPEVHFVIEGEPFQSIHKIYLKAVERGFTGSERAMSGRVCGKRQNTLTWKYLLHAPDLVRGEAFKKHQKKAHDAMKEVIAKLDARKKSL